KPGLIEGNCPNCGTPLEMNQSANCASCSALLRSGEYDWVLSEITQDCEWRPGGRPAVSGLRRLQQTDPELNPQAVEDRALVIFWREAAAQRVGKVEPLGNVASPEFAKGFAAQLGPGRAEGYTFIGQRAVGSVDVLGFSRTGDQARRQMALVEVRWMGKRMRVAGDGAARPDGN